ncbi:flagellar hook-length control protein FliK [Aureimonas pseudogalii]|uniref:Flagellar hook-length control protein FliK n=1 Tax=Aureimonas pseudogalii TaxID=1744844 RepID=A0A7W6H296_9HYPH|nr:flagellar hook-length control protein FliK [Aureimonas pseudogalii]MBB3996395.1 flagellar hook-length control protein FliK [Aureimonas pseudogalii]
MKIELAPVAVEKDPVGSRSSGRDESARNTQGEAFDKAVRGAAARPAKADGQGAGPRAAAADASPKDVAAADDTAVDDTASAGETDPVADGTATAQPDAAAADIRALQSLLGLIGLAATLPAQASAPAGAATPQEPSTEKPVATPDADAAVSVPADAASEKVKALRLDVLRMETHFEPHQDGMVLVTTAGKADATGLAAESAPGGLAVAAASTPGNELAALLSAPARSSGREAAAAKDAASSASATEGRAEAPRLSFDEALAQLGQGAGERSGSGGSGQSSRDGSNAAQTALADLDLRADVRTADASSLTGPGASLAGGQANLAGQVAGRILEALGTSVPSSGAPAPQPGEAHVRMRAGGAALKTLTIQLQPEHLGTLEVSMRLNEGKLTLELSASQADTAVLLADDRGTLRAVLEHAGFSVDDAAITVVTRDAVASAARSSDAGTSSGGGSDSRSPSSGGQSRGGDAGTGEGSRQSPERRSAPAPETPRRDAAPAPQRAGSTYL